MEAYNYHFLGSFFKSKAEHKYQKPLKYAQKIKEKIEIHNCPLCGKKNYIVVGKFEIDAVIDSWIERKGFNPIADVYRNEILEKRRCENCGLYFYNYYLPDSEELYETLQEKTDYYPNFRQEYGIVTEVIQKLKPNSLLEIGSGNGSFLDRIRHIVPRVVGSEYNSHAAALCREKGLEILTEDISQIKEQFDIICHFEVLEHVSNTRELMDNTVRLLKKGGKLIIGTPDPEGINSIIGKGELNMPPHHQFDFSKQAFDWLAKEYKLKIFHYSKNKLRYSNYSRYVKVITGKELTHPDLTGFYETKRRYTGNSHVVVFKKR